MNAYTWPVGIGYSVQGDCIHAKTGGGGGENENNQGSGLCLWKCFPSPR